MPKMKTTEWTVGDVVRAAIQDIEELAQECRDVVDNASDGLLQTQRIQTLDETASELENHQEPDIPDLLEQLKLSITEPNYTARQLGKRSRATRCADACNLLTAVVVFLENRDDEDSETLRDELQSVIDGCDGIEFPGMYG